MPVALFDLVTEDVVRGGVESFNSGTNTKIHFHLSKYRDSIHTLYN